MNLPNYYQQNYNPYQYYQQPQQYHQPTVLNGKVVDRMDDISANDVHMDGSVAVFPKRDMSEVYIKRWTANGEITTVRFCPILDHITGQESSSTKTDAKSVYDAFFDEISALQRRFDRLDERIDSIVSKSAQSKTRKVTDDD